MPTGEEFLSGWTSVVQGGTSTPFIISAVTPMTVTAGKMQQLISTPGIQVTTIHITILLASVVEMAPISIQSQLWLEGQQSEADDEERVVEVELDKKQGDLQEEEGDTQEGSQEEKESQTQEKLQDESKEKVSGEEESLGEDSEDSVGRKGKGDS